MVTAANTVDEYGAHLTSPTLAPKSNIKSGSLKMDYSISVEHTPYALHNTHRHSIPSHIFPDFNSPIGSARHKYIRIEFVEIDAIDG